MNGSAAISLVGGAGFGLVVGWLAARQVWLSRSRSLNALARSAVGLAIVVPVTAWGDFQSVTGYLSGLAVGVLISVMWLVFLNFKARSTA